MREDLAEDTVTRMDDRNKITDPVNQADVADLGTQPGAVVVINMYHAAELFVADMTGAVHRKVTALTVAC